MHEHLLTNCKPKPLSSYLKALGLLRLLSEQKDPATQGCWREESFLIRTALSKEELEAFFCQKYTPTPIVSPWNGGSGFYPGDTPDGIQAISASIDPRFAPYREVIEKIKQWPEMPTTPDRVVDVANIIRSAVSQMRPGKRRDDTEKLLRDLEESTPEGQWNGMPSGEVRLAELEGAVKKGKSPELAMLRIWWNAAKKARGECTRMERGGNKEAIIAACRSRLPEVCLAWVDAVCALHSDGKASYNPVLGTGGNELRLDLSNNFMQRVAELLMRSAPENTAHLFGSAIYGTVISGLAAGKIGQYDPGRAGGYNQGTDIETKDFKINPWDFVLMLEGTLLLSSAMTRRNQTGEDAQLTSPFTVYFSPVGLSAAEPTQERRKETWFPLWPNPATIAEVKYLFGEGRSTVGVRSARTGLDFSRAIGMLGVDRGLSSFERFAFLERRGKSYVALPAGRLPVHYNPSLELLNELDRLTRALDRFLGMFATIPATFTSLRRQLDEAVFSCCKQPNALKFNDLIRALGRTERAIATRDRAKDPALPSPLCGLSPGWIAKGDDGSSETRIAASIASIGSTGEIGPIRSTLSGVDKTKPWLWGQEKNPDIWLGNTLPERLGRVLARRVLDASKLRVTGVPIAAQVTVAPEDLMPFLWGDTDDNKVEDLLWGFTLIDWGKPGLRKIAKDWSTALSDYPISRTYALLKLLHTSSPAKRVHLPVEPRIVHLLEAGRVREACAQAIHRLRVSELKPFNVDYEENLDPGRLLASMLVPVNQQWKLESLVLGA